jgi:hypothetical protein
MTRRHKVEVEPVSEVEPVLETEGEPVIEAEGEVPAYEKHDLVRVKVLAEQGLLAGRAVWRGEVHEVLYWQYQQAAHVNPDGYELLG